MNQKARADRLGSKQLRRELLIAAITAATACLVTLSAQGAVDYIKASLHPSPYRHLEGTYAGHWEWTDKDNKLQKTDDTVFFQSTADGKLVGRGSDLKLGTYKFEGNLTRKHISAAYLSDHGSLQPAQSGSFELDVVQSNRLTLKGVWTGFYDGARIEGPVILTKTD